MRGCRLQYEERNCGHQYPQVLRGRSRSGSGGSHHLLDRGPLGFADLDEGIPDISNTVLADSLERLEADGIVTRRIVSDQPFRVEYDLTERGTSLEPVIDTIAEWGRTEQPAISACGTQVTDRE